MGALQEEQAIIGGESSDGLMLSHNHSIITKNSFSINVNSGGEGSVISGFTSFDEDNIENLIGEGKNESNLEVPYSSYTNNIGNGKLNKAYGFGIETGLFVWKRTA